MSAAPLGSRYVPTSKKVRKIALKPPTDTYFVNVNIAPYISDEGDVNSPAGSWRLPASATTNATLRDDLQSSIRAAAVSRGSSPASLKLSATTTPAQPPSGGGASVFGKHIRGALDYSECASHAIAVHLHTSDTVEMAIDKTVAAFAATHGRPLGRPASHYMLCRCFADYSIDFAFRGMHGESHTPLVSVLEFPYFLSLQVIPYQQQREDVELRLEPSGRAHLREEHRSFVLFAMEYANMLRRMHQQYEFLVGRDLESRRQKKDLEQIARHEVLQRLMFAAEREQRARIVESERRQWNLEAYSATAVLQHCTFVQDHYDRVSRECRLLHRQLIFTWETEARVRTLSMRLEKLREVCFDLFDSSLRQRRALYTETRLATDLKSAQVTQDDPDVTVGVRREFTKSTLPHRFHGPDIVNSDVLCKDPFVVSRSKETSWK